MGLSNLRGKHSRVGFQMMELVHDKARSSERALKWKRGNPAPDISKLLSWLQMVVKCSQIKGWEKSSKCTGENTYQGCQLGRFFSISSELGQACMMNGPARGFYCSKSHTGRRGPQAVLSDSFITHDATGAKKDFSCRFIDLVLHFFIFILYWSIVDLQCCVSYLVL